MSRPTVRTFPPGRVVALALIAILAGGAAFVRLTSGVEPVSVPAGAQPGDLIIEPCTYEAEGGTYAADCGTLVVSENPDAPDSRLIALPVIRVRATSDESSEPVFYLTGGPGMSNMDVEYGGRFVGNRDFVLVGYRGIDGSVRLDCPEVESAIKRSADLLSGGAFQAIHDGYRTCADRLIGQGLDPASYGLVQQVDDLETARVAFGYDRINLLSESAGTRTALIYAWRFPDSIHRSVLVGVNPPGNFLWYPETTEEQVGRYAALCANDDSCSRRTDDLAATLQRNSADVPDRWLFLPIKEANARTASMLGLFESTTAAFPIAAPMILDAWLAANEGDASGLWFISTLSDLVVSGLFVHGQYAAAGQLDAQAAREYFADASLDVSNFGVAGTASTWAGGRLADAWPAHRGGDYSQVPTSEVDMLLIGGELDVSTPPQNATRELLPYLPNGHEVVLAGFGHTGTFFAEQPDAGTHLIRTYLDSGRIDDSLYEPVLVDFTPPMTLTGIAKILLATMLLFVLISLLSLAWMAHHVRKRGGFGPAAGALLRSLYPVVLGLGGWFLGVLIALTTMPRVTVDNELLAIGAVCPPIALGIYYAWTHRDRPIDTRRMGLVLASGGAIAGGWFGFNAAGVAFIGLWFAIVGAIAGANLLLILLDIATARSVVRRPGLSVPLEPSREPIRR